MVGNGESGVALLDDYSFCACVLKPTRRGRVSLRSTRTDDKPRVVHNFLTTLTIGKVWRRSGRPTAYRMPPSDRTQAILTFVQRYARSACHPVGTCAIGRVVDPELKVLGIDGLRVVDASVMSSIVLGNTNATVIAIADDI